MTSPSKPPPPPLVIPKDNEPGSFILKGATEKLVGIVNETANKLDQIWDNVGFSQEEREKQLNDLLDEVRRLCDEKVDDEEDVRSAYVQNIEDTMNQVKDSAMRLGELEGYQGLETDEEGVAVSTYSLSEQLCHFERHAKTLTEKIDARTTELEALRHDLCSRCEILDDDLDDTFHDVATDLSQARIDAFSAEVERLEGVLSQRVIEVTETVGECQALLQEMSIEASTELDKQIMGSLSEEGELVNTTRSATCTGVGSAMLASLHARKDELLETREFRSNRLLELGDEVARLWEMLAIDEESQKAFEDSLTGGLSEATIAAGEAELARLEELKQEKLSELIGDRRGTIEGLWEQMGYSEERRAEFKGFSAVEADYSDELLTQHEEEIEKLSARLEAMQPLLRLIKKFEDATQARVDLEEAQKNKDRLKGRGSAAILKKEEAMAKQIKMIPKIKDSLTKQLKEWEKAENEPLQVNGVNYLDKMQEVEGAYNDKKEAALAEKKAAKKASIGALGLAGNQSNVTGNRRGSQTGPKRTLKGGGGKAKANASAEAAPLAEVTASSRNSSD